MKFNYILLFVVLGTISCSTKEIKDTATTHKDTISVPSIDSVKLAVPPQNINFLPSVHRQYDDFARFIAGYKQLDSSSLSTVESYPQWQKFSKRLDSNWAVLEKNRLSKMRTWSETEIRSAHVGKRDLLYTFSGPDMLNAFTLFPTATNYTLIALEPVGQVKDFSHTKPENIEQYLGSIDEALSDIFEKSYFITRKMLSHLQPNKANGTLPLICLFLERTGNKIIDIKRIKIDSTGTANEYDWDLKTKASGVKVYFVNEKEPQRLRSVTYIKADMENKALDKNKAMTNWLNKFSDVDTYIKSASYILHYKDFSMIRNVILNASVHILQDDTGIAYKFYDKSTWTCKLYGKYVKPVDDFEGVDQLDLKKAYSDSTKIQKLPFSLGYHWGTNDQNLMFSVKKYIGKTKNSNE
jgi:hypothetical protein